MRNRLRKAREERRISAPELAEKLQVHPSTLTNWEAGRRQITPDKLVHGTREAIGAERVRQ